MSGFTLAYAGGIVGSGGDNKGGIKISGGQATSTITNAIFQNNYQYGIRMSNSSALALKNTIFRNHTEEKVNVATALKIFDSTVSLENITFQNNDLDISAVGSHSVTADTATIDLTPSTEPVDLF